MNKNNMNNTNASVSASKRNRHEDAVKVISLLTVLKKTAETASHFEEYKNDFESFRSAAVQALITASDIPDDGMVINGHRCPMNVNGLESMLIRMDKLDGKYQKAAAANDKLPYATAEYLSLLSQVFNVGIVTSKNHTDIVSVDSEIGNHTSLMKNSQNNENAGTASAARDALALNLVKLYERIQIIEGRVGELEDIGERVPDLDEEVGNIYKRINTLEEKAKPPINIPAEACGQNQLMRDNVWTSVDMNQLLEHINQLQQMDEIDVPDIPDIDADVQTGDIAAVRTGDIKVGRVGHNINIRVGGNLVINGDDDIK